MVLSGGSGPALEARRIKRAHLRKCKQRPNQRGNEITCRYSAHGSAGQNSSRAPGAVSCTEISCAREKLNRRAAGRAFLAGGHSL
jgi:hypothetical protein